jgi:ATP-binding cassette subfamily B protein
VLVGSVRRTLDAGAGDISEPVFWFTLILILLLLAGILGVIQKYCSQRLTDELNIRLSGEVFRHAAPLDLEFFEDSSMQDILARSTENTGHRFFDVVVGSINTVSLVVQLISLIGVLVFIDFLVSGILLVLSVPWLIFQLRLAEIRYQAYMAKTRRQRWTSYYRGLFTNRSNIPTIKLFGLHEMLLGRFNRTLQNIISIDKRTYRIQLIGDLIATIVLTFGFWLAILYIGYKTFQGQVSFEMLLTYWIATGRFRTCLDGVIGSGTQLVENALFIQNIKTFFEQQPKLSIPGKPKVSRDLQGRVELKDVSFKYPGTDSLVLKDMNLLIRPGETVAFVGHNGAGKTTLARLIMRLYDVTSGSVLIDDEDVRDMDVESLYRNIAYVPDTPVEFEASLRENISFGNWPQLENSDEMTDRLAVRAGLDQIVAVAPNGLDTEVGRLFGNYDLSKGQWQKISIARAHARDAAIYILDEPTANLDIRSEVELFRAFIRFTAQKTTILISHRFSSVRMADRIFVLEEGRVAEEGSHAELMNKGGIYTTLYRLYQDGFSDE